MPPLPEKSRGRGVSSLFSPSFRFILGVNDGGMLMTEYGAGIAAKIAWEQGVQIDLRGETPAITVSAEQLARATSLQLVIDGAGLDRVAEFLTQVDPILPSGLMICIAVSELIRHGAFLNFSIFMEAAGYFTIDVVYERDASRCYLKKCAELTLDERCCRFTKGGRDFFLTHPFAQDMMRRFPVHFKEFYEEEFLAAMQGYDAPGLMLDIGGNIGNHSIYAAGVMGRKVMTFEPVPNHYACLLKNIADNNLSDKIKPFRLALGQGGGKARAVNLNILNSGSARMEECAEGDVEVMRLDDFLSVFEDPVALIKIDVEGMEEDVMHGAQAVLATYSPVVFAESFDDATRQKLTEVMTGFGYRFKGYQCHNTMLEFVSASS